MVSALVFKPAQLRNLLSIEIIIRTVIGSRNKSTAALILKRREALTNLSFSHVPLQPRLGNK